MSTFSNERVPDLPMMLTTILPGFRVGRDMPLSDAATRALLDGAEQPLFNVVDIRSFEFSIEDMILASNKGSRGENPIWQDSRIRETIFVSENSLVYMAAAGLNSFSFGYLKVRVMPDLDSVIAYVREQMQVQTGGSL